MLQEVTQAVLLCYSVFSSSIRGIGKACAFALAQAGARFCLVLRKGSSTETLDNLVAAGHTAKAVYCDLSDLDAVKNIFQEALNIMGDSIHILVNCAGIQRRNPALDFSEKDWDDVRPNCLAAQSH